MSELIDNLTQASSDGFEQVRRLRGKHPTGWEPSVEERGDGTASAVSTPYETDTTPDEEELIRGWNLDPEEWRIVGKVNCRRWQTYDERWLHYYKADLVRRSGAGIVDYDELVDSIRRHRKRKAPSVSPDSEAFVFCVADVQVGKADGDGLKGTVERFMTCLDQAEDRIRELRAAGRRIDRLYVFGLGDLIESCLGSYATQTFTVELNLRDQLKVMRRLILKTLQQLAPLFNEVVVSAVPGNHGIASRTNGKQNTNTADNHDVALFEQVAEVLEANPDAYGHVRFNLPNGEISVTMDVCGTITTITHGHITKGSGTPQKKLIDWWKNQAHGQHPAGDSTLLLSGHYHHLIVQQSNAKTFIQAPAMDGGSDWWTNMTGDESPPGMLTLVVGNGSWKDLQVLDGIRG